MTMFYKINGNTCVLCLMYIYAIYSSIFNFFFHTSLKPMYIYVYRFMNYDNIHQSIITHTVFFLERHFVTHMNPHACCRSYTCSWKNPENSVSVVILPKVVIFFKLESVQPNKFICFWQNAWAWLLKMWFKSNHPFLRYCVQFFFEFWFFVTLNFDL